MFNIYYNVLSNSENYRMEENRKGIYAVDENYF